MWLGQALTMWGRVRRHCQQLTDAEHDLKKIGATP
ncbi:MAG: hypothetical protein ACI8RZ_003029 [Myxococcota bacterium]|jgi:hypothetical protein